MDRTFLLPIPNRHIKYSMHTFPNGAIHLSRIAPYDETEYHWATRMDTPSLGYINKWTIYNGKDCKVHSAAADATPEAVAAECFRLDEEKGLKRTGGIW